MENREWRTEDGGQKTEDGGSRMEDGGLRMENSEQRKAIYVTSYCALCAYCGKKGEE
jgi:hypothetical protein